jgi:hypothetical protein
VLKNLKNQGQSGLCRLCENYVLYSLLQILFHDPIPKLDCMGLYNPLGHINQPSHLGVCLSQTLMGTMLKLLHCVEFLYFHTLVINVKLLEKLGDRAENKNPSPNNRTITTTSRSGRTHTNTYDSGRWDKCRCN